MKISYITNLEVYNRLISKDEHNDIEKDELSYIENFMKINPSTDIESIRKEIMALSNLSQEVSSKIIDIMPATREELTAILSSYNIMPDDSVLEKILDYVKGL
ncbi:RNA polymerase Rpb4 family protein [Picrophilus oshimae]|uniref:DNA-directed RNA polymerase subunit Rpo4 n=1 Tax=Picrophilus torridus (strain ATCC 700027 / DSM 9790 / JCM 10055 / NBRC 100828 / KAW 2/3) TaxID=1122961 RepID=Q6L229_PICTO|nr:RNA polymerase Rpb4 family protein [Picrophilus oshimae]AAT42973.1 DNA-directed RNA-Polymerase subunit F [Picrophilus oshimae DSM 9789]